MQAPCGGGLPVYVLIHGGGATARFWDRLLPHLDRPALTVDLSGRAGKVADLATLTVEDEAASVVADIEAAALGNRSFWSRTPQQVSSSPCRSPPSRVMSVRSC